MNAITSLIDPESWEENGGAGSLQPIGGALAVNNTEAVHKKLTELFTALRRETDNLRTLSIDAQWLLLDEAHPRFLGDVFRAVDPHATGEKRHDDPLVVALHQRAPRLALAAKGCGAEGGFVGGDGARSRVRDANRWLGGWGGSQDGQDVGKSLHG